MEPLKHILQALPTLVAGDQTYLDYQAVTDAVAAFLFPDTPEAEIDEAAYAHILKTADALCRELGYRDVVKLTSPAVSLDQTGLYWTTTAAQPDPVPILSQAGPHTGRTEINKEHPDKQLSRLGLDEVSRDHFNIPVTASAAVVDLLHRAVASGWPNDYKGVWHDILGMCTAGGLELTPGERRFTVIIRGLPEKRYWPFVARIKRNAGEALFLYICLADEPAAKADELFPLGHVVMTQGVADLNIDFTPYLARHAGGDWGTLDAADQRRNDAAVKDGRRIFSAYDASLESGGTTRIWIITEWNRDVTTVLLPSEY